MKKAIPPIACFLLISLFAYTGLSKLSDHTVFHSQLNGLPFIQYAAPVLWWLLPVLELGIAIILVVPKLRLTGYYMSAILLFLFTVYLGGMILSGMELPCSCGGVIQYLSWKQHIILNIFFIILSVMGIYFQKGAELSTHIV